MGNHKFNPRAAGFVGPSSIQDAFGRPLTEGDMVIAHQMKLAAPQFVVRQIRPNLAIGAEPHTSVVILVAQVALQVRNNTPVAEIIRTRTAEEMGAVAAPPTDGSEAPDAADAPPPFAGPVSID